MSILAWLKGLMRRRLDDEDFQDEIRAHLAIATDEKMADGADRQTARYAALRDFGNVTLTTEAARRVWSPWWLDALHDLASDVRYAIRALAKNPAFALTLVGVLALGIGLNVPLFKRDLTRLSASSGLLTRALEIRPRRTGDARFEFHRR